MSPTEFRPDNCQLTADFGAPTGQRDLRILGELVRQICSAALDSGNIEVLLFGSWAKGSAGPHSDIDIAFSGEVPRGLLGRLAEAIEDSRILSRVDLVDLQRASPAIRQAVARDGRSWPI